MKLLIVVLVYSATLFIGSAQPIPVLGKRSRQYTCMKDEAPLVSSLHQIKFSKEGIVYKCRELIHPDQNTRSKHPSVLEVPENAVGTQIVSCVQLKSNESDIKYPETYFGAADVNNDKVFMCRDITKQGNRTSKGFKNPIDWAHEGTDIVFGTIQSTLTSTELIR